MLQDFSVKNGEGNNTGIVENPILNAARNGNAAEIRRLLQLKNVETHRPLYPRDWKYTFKNLCEKDSDGRTALHLAAAVGQYDFCKVLENALFIFVLREVFNFSFILLFSQVIQKCHLNV